MISTRRSARWSTVAALATLAATGASTAARAKDRSPRVTTLFSPAEMPHTERTAAVGQRIFATSDSNLFEIVKSPHDETRKVSIAQASVTLTEGQTVPGAFLALGARGRVLFATATAFDATGVPYASMLYRIELGAAPGKATAIAAAPFVGHTIPFLPNGMAIDRNGELFITNSFSATTGEAAILKLKVRSAPFSFQETSWLPANLGGPFPNGVQLDGNTLYLASLSTVLQVPIQHDGTAGSVAKLYSANPDDFLDDFALVSGELVVCEIDNPFAPPVTATSQLTVVARTGPTAGEVVRVIPLADAGVHPSSVARFHGSADRGAFLVTDYTGGGLFSVAF
jgi:hypothetical protein